MTTFQRWTDTALSVLQASCHCKRGQVQELLAAALGHRTYASFKVNDLAAVNSGAAAYLMLDNEAALARARGLELEISTALWDKATMALRPSGISGGASFVRLEGMSGAARFCFTDSQDPEFVRIWKRHGAMPQARRVPQSWTWQLPETAALTPPTELSILVLGEVVVQGGDLDVVVPTTATVRFTLVARRGYGAGTLHQIGESGVPWLEEPEDALGDVYGP